MSADSDSDETIADHFGDASEGFTTDSSEARFSYTNDLLSLLLVGFAIAASAYLMYTGEDVPLWLASTLAVAIMSAVVWAFGKGVVKEARKLIDSGE